MSVGVPCFRHRNSYSINKLPSVKSHPYRSPSIASRHTHPGVSLGSDVVYQYASRCPLHRHAAVAGATSSTTNQSKLMRSIETVWPDPSTHAVKLGSSTAAELQVKHAVAVYLAICPVYRATCNDVARHLATNVGTVKQLGSKKKLRSILEEDSCFKVEDLYASRLFVEHYVTLNVQQLYLRASAGNCSTTLTARQLMQYVTQHKWHSSNQQLNTVRRALAVHLVTQANAAYLTAGSAVDGPACDDPASYSMLSARAGELLLQRKHHFQAEVYSTTAVGNQA